MPDNRTDLPPPTPTNFTAVAAISHIMIQTDAPGFTQGNGYLRTRIYGAINTGGNPPTFSTATEIHQFTGQLGSINSDPNTKWHLWAKWETNDGVLSSVPAGGTNGVVATTGLDVSKMVLAMTGPGNPFKVTTTNTTLADGTVLPPGVYMSDTFIHSSQIGTAQIQKLAVDSGAIKDLAVVTAKMALLAVKEGQIDDLAVSRGKIQKLAVAEGNIANGAITNLKIGNEIKSSNYSPNLAGWRLDKTGNAEFNNALRS